MSTRDKLSYDLLSVGDFLGDTHDNHVVEHLVQERLLEPIRVKDIVTIPGEHYAWLDTLLSEQLDNPVPEHPPHRYMNKLVVVLGELHHSSREGLLIGWSWDGQWVKFAKLYKQSVLPKES